MHMKQSISTKKGIDYHMVHDNYFFRIDFTPERCFFLAAATADRIKGLPKSLQHIN